MLSLLVGDQNYAAERGPVIKNVKSHAHEKVAGVAPQFIQ